MAKFELEKIYDKDGKFLYTLKTYSGGYAELITLNIDNAKQHAIDLIDAIELFVDNINTSVIAKTKQ